MNLAQKFHDASEKLSKEEESSKRKDSDTGSGTVIKKPKYSSRETSHLFFDTSNVRRKLFDSVEKEAEIQTGQKMNDSVDDAFFSKTPHEDFSDSGMVAAFEGFIGQLKKLFWSQYKRMETSAQNTLRTSEKNVSTLLKQIHECRLSKLETFQKIFVEELASLEKETQILANMEKDAVVCTASPVPALGGLEDYWYPVARLHEGYTMPAKRMSSVAENGQSDQRNCLFVFALVWGQFALLPVECADISVQGQVPLLQAAGLCLKE
ncbi:synaptonemal complex protein 2-like [Limosa lapponica baueri]|uniref:Synaptonemal complex protein 2-like n=1 Tax=Limosa lapponica baueri TaxID=1758121 RepID=A0A2I0U229_LIMLA|nr:synaptonemal complex protein 2-like [Limosa lapponica baueri]